VGTELKKEALQIADWVLLPSHHRHVYVELALTAHDDNCKCKSNCTPRLYCQSRDNLARNIGKSKRALSKTIRNLVELGILTHLKRGRIGITAEYKLNTIEQVALLNDKEQELQDLLYESVGTTKTKSRNHKVKEQVLQDPPNTFNTSNTKNYFRSANNVKERIHPPVREVLIEEPNPATPEAIQKLVSETKALMRRTKNGSLPSTK
jgi:predicted nucleotide-binding protein (sugar kinase/HSP70/actin superfamily)